MFRIIAFGIAHTAVSMSLEFGQQRMFLPVQAAQYRGERMFLRVQAAPLHTGEPRVREQAAQRGKGNSRGTVLVRLEHFAA